MAEELFDHIGLRIITQTRFDTMRILRFLISRFVIVTHNIKPSRSMNTLVDLNMFKRRHQRLIRRAIKENWSEEKLLENSEKEIQHCGIKRENRERNLHSSQSYRSIQFTHRQLIKYTNPFLDGV